MGIAKRSNLSSFLDVLAVPCLLPVVLLPHTTPMILGFLPLSKTFFLALMPTQSTSCFMASRSETARLGAVLRMVLVRGKVA